jgi:tRNA-binding protein
MAEVTPEQFFQVEIRVGQIVAVEEFPKARKPAYKLWIDFGEAGKKQSSARLTERYSIADLLGRRIVAVTNFPPRKVADFLSEVLVLGVEAAPDQVVLLQPDGDAPLGTLVF